MGDIFYSKGLWEARGLATSLLVALVGSRGSLGLPPRVWPLWSQEFKSKQIKLVAVGFYQRKFSFQILDPGTYPPHFFPQSIETEPRNLPLRLLPPSSHEVLTAHRTQTTRDERLPCGISGRILDGAANEAASLQAHV